MVVGLEKEREAKRKIWIVNHYASCPDYPNEHRHFDIARELVKQNYEVTIIAASTMHNMGVNLIEDDSPILEKSYEGVRYLFLKTRSYEGNGVNRILNMRDFLKGFRRIVFDLPRPDVIVASSPHLPSLNVALDVADKLDVPCICEVRDLWPQSLVEYGYLPGWDPVSCKLYRDERRAYERADALVFTMEGGADYIRDKGWDTGNGGKIDLAKVHHINNGIDLNQYDFNKIRNCVVPELRETDAAKIVYAGSVRQVNDLGFLIEVASQMKEDDVCFVILGDGDELNELRERVLERGLDNISFVGRVDRSDVPACLERASLLLLHSASQKGLSRYGMSQNKLFDYLASGKPVLSNLPSQYSIVNRYDCGVEMSFKDSRDYASQIRRMLFDEAAMIRWGKNARSVAELYSFETLAVHYAEVIEKVLKEEQ